MMFFKTSWQGLLTTVLLLMCALASPAARYSVAPMTITNAFITPDSTAIAVKITNYGSEEVKQIGYSLFNVTLQKSAADRTVNFETPIATGDTRTFELRLDSPATYGKTSYLLTISTVNGNTNEASTNYTYADVYCVSRVPTRRIVMEEYTGLWCGYCPRGMVTLEYLSRLYPETFIGIAVHCRNGSYEPLDVNAYGDTRPKWAQSYPSMWLSRKTKVGDWVEGLSGFESEIKNPAMTDVEVSAVWRPGRNDIDVTTIVNPCMDVDSGRYGLAYVLTEDGLSNPSWGQFNLYAGDTYSNAPEEMERFTKGGSYVYGLTFNHTALTSKGIDMGMEGSLDAPMEADVEVTHTMSFEDVSSNRLLQNKDSLSVIVMVIDKNTRCVDNAARCRISSGETTGITSLSRPAASERALRFNLEGQRVGADYKGIVIENGRKHLVK